MKRQLFSDRVTLMMTYLKAHLPENTYWCDEMMKMLVYLADWEATKICGKPLSNLKWYITGKSELEAMGLENITHWENYLPKRCILQRMKDTITRRQHFETLTHKELNILEKVISLRTCDDLRVGSFAFRSHVFNTPPLLSKKSSVVEFPIQNDPIHSTPNESSPNEILTFQHSAIDS